MQIIYDKRYQIRVKELRIIFNAIADFTQKIRSEG